jgi:hypothetical protein
MPNRRAPRTTAPCTVVGKRVRTRTMPSRPPLTLNPRTDTDEHCTIRIPATPLSSARPPVTLSPP